jgi:hypothetical protein
MQTLHIQGPYEDRLADTLVLFLAGQETRLVIQTLPGMGVVTHTLHLLLQARRAVIDIRLQPMDTSDTVEDLEQAARGFGPDAVLVLNDTSLDLYNSLPNVREFAENRQALGGKVIIIAAY